MRGYGTKLDTDAMGGEQWQYTFNLQREGGQASIDKALSHPASDEMDDWNQYQREKAKAKVKKVTELVLEPSIVERGRSRTGL